MARRSTDKRAIDIYGRDIPSLVTHLGQYLGGDGRDREIRLSHRQLGQLYAEGVGVMRNGGSDQITGCGKHGDRLVFTTFTLKVVD